MLTLVAKWIQFYTTKATSWLLLSAFALDQISDTIIKKVERRHWIPVKRSMLKHLRFGRPL